MSDFLSDLLMDPKKSAPLAAALSTILVQLAAARGLLLDAHAADAISLALITVAGVVAASHAHVEHAETTAQGHVDVAKANKYIPAPGQS